MTSDRAEIRVRFEWAGTGGVPKRKMNAKGNNVQVRNGWQGGDSMKAPCGACYEPGHSTLNCKHYYVHLAFEDVGEYPGRVVATGYGVKPTADIKHRNSKGPGFANPKHQGALNFWERESFARGKTGSALREAQKKGSRELASWNERRGHWERQKGRDRSESDNQDEGKEKQRRKEYVNVIADLLKQRDDKEGKESAEEEKARLQGPKQEGERVKEDLLVFSEEEKKKIWEGGCGTSVSGGSTVQERHERAKISNQGYGMGNPLEGDSMFRY